MNRSFRDAFGIPERHRLMCLSWRGSLTGASQNWEHHEFDGGGRMVARYESWLAESSSGLDTGYRRYDEGGALVGGGWLPPIRSA